MTASLILQRRFTPEALIGAMKMTTPYSILADFRAFGHAASGVNTGDARFEETLYGLKVLLFKNVPVWIEPGLKVETREDDEVFEEVLRFIILGRGAHQAYMDRRAEAWGFRQHHEPPIETAEDYLAARDQFQTLFPERRFGGVYNLNRVGIDQLLQRDDVLDVRFLIPRAASDLDA